MPLRDPLPTLTEDDLRTAGERVTQPPPEPIADLVRRMMAQTDEDPPPAVRPPRRPSPPADNPPNKLSGSAEGELSVEDEIDLADLPPSMQAELVDELMRASLAALGSRAHVPVSLVSPERARSLSLDPSAGFILSMIDGATSIDEILDAAPVPPHSALRILIELRDAGVIELRAP